MARKAALFTTFAHTTLNYAYIENEIYIYVNFAWKAVNEDKWLSGLEIT